MMFWDSSALMSVLASQQGALPLKRLMEDDPAMVLWWGTRVELVSAACRLRREELIDDAGMSRLVARIQGATDDADHIEPIELVRQTAVRVLRVHNLRAGDALQLAAALVWTDHDPSGARFVCGDNRLREAAAREGFTVWPENR